MSKGQRTMLWRRIRSMVKGLAAMILAVVMVVGLMPAMEVQAADQNAYYLLVLPKEPRISGDPTVSITPGELTNGLGSDAELARGKKVQASWFGDDLILSQLPTQYSSYTAVNDVIIDDANSGSEGIKNVNIDSTDYNVISSSYEGKLKKGDNDGTPSNYSIEIEGGNRFFVDDSNSKKFKTITTISNIDGHDYTMLKIAYSSIMRKTADETKKTGSGSGIISTFKTGSSGAKLYYSYGYSGCYFKMTYDGSDVLSWTGYDKETKNGEEYYLINISAKLYTPSEITLSPNTEYTVNYLMDKPNSLYSISITGTEIPGGDDPGKDDPGQGDPGQTVSENARTLVVKNKSSITKLFSKYGESGYKYRFKVEDKAQRKIARVTRKGKIRVKRSGKVKVSLFRKVKGGVWSKIEEQEIKTEKPIVKTKVTDLKVGDTLEASSFITNQKDLVNKPTSYVSTNTKVATVESKTGKIKILKKGSTKIKMIYGAEKGAAVYKTRLKVNQ